MACWVWEQGCVIDWNAIAAIGTWSAVAAALYLASRDSRRRSAEGRKATQATSEIVASDLVVEMVEGFQNLIEVVHHYVRLRFDSNQVPAESDFVIAYQNGLLTMRVIPGDECSRTDLAALDVALAAAVAKLRSDSRLLNANLASMASAILPTGADRQTLIARVAPTILPAMYHLGRRYLNLGQALQPFGSPEANEYILGFNANVAEDVIRFVTAGLTNAAPGAKEGEP